MIEYKGQCMGVKVTPDDRSKTGGHPRHAEVTLLVEDDENWFEKWTFDSYWLDEMIEMLTLARKALKKKAKKGKWGYDFKEEV